MLSKAVGAVDTRLNANALGQAFALGEPSRPRSGSTSDWRSEMLVVPCFWAGCTANAEEANVGLQKHRITAGSVSFPTLVNTRALQLHEKLLVHKPKKAASSSAAAGEAKPAAKKSRRS